MFKILLTLSITLGALVASPVKVGTPLYKLNSYKYETPQGRTMRVSKKTSLVIVAFEKDTGKTVNTFLGTKSPYYLQKKHAVFIADINKMPDMVTKMFALPKLQEYKHLIYLHYGEEFEKSVPAQSEKITLLYVKNGKINKISYITTKEELQAAIER